jgi:hypothetical protein
MNTGHNEITVFPPALKGAPESAGSPLAAVLRRACRRYCERVVANVLPEAPLGGHDWFLDLTEAR